MAIVEFRFVRYIGAGIAEFLYPGTSKTEYYFVTPDEDFEGEYAIDHLDDGEFNAPSQGLVDYILAETSNADRVLYSDDDRHRQFWAHF